MGVFYLFFYLLGGLSVALGTSHLLDAIMESESLVAPLKFIGFGAFLVVAGGVLQAIVAKRRGHDGILGILPPMNAVAALTAAAIWLAPLAWSWAQFEMFMNPVDSYPIISMAGAIALAFGLGSRMAGESPMRAPIGMMAVAFVGMPIGLLSIGLMTAHFRYHLTDVRTSIRDSTTYETRTFIDAADEPEFLHEETALGDETSDLINALANAKTVDVAEEVAAGRMRQLEDGSYVVVNPDGTDAQMGTADDLKDEMGAAAAADEATAASKRKKAWEAFEAEREKRRTGGRIFR